MEKQEVVIRVRDLRKSYPLYGKSTDRLKEALHPLRKKYHRDFVALKDVSFEVKQGETVGIIGRNGSGKSTLLKILTGVLTPSDGCAITRGRVLALLELGAGFNPDLSGLENVYFNGSLFGVSRREISHRLEAILAFADIGEFIHQPIKTYSSGMIVRLAFAVIANMDADILIIDEALSVGDAFFVQKCMRFLREFIERGTLIFVSHDTSAVLSLCDRAIWLHEGSIRNDGVPKMVAEKYLESLFENEESFIRGGDIYPIASAQHQENDYRDMREQWINCSPWRNDIELFHFDPSAPSFGDGGASIIDVFLGDCQGVPLKWVVGGELVRLIITAQANQQIHNAILGFYVKDRLGQILFGENTFNFAKKAPPSVQRGEKIIASFEFPMPILPAGDYSVTVALAEGDQKSHIQHHWIHDALIFTSHSSGVSTGLVGVPMRSISLQLI